MASMSRSLSAVVKDSEFSKKLVSIANRLEATACTVGSVRIETMLIAVWNGLIEIKNSTRIFAIDGELARSIESLSNSVQELLALINQKVDEPMIDRRMGRKEYLFMQKTERIRSVVDSEKKSLQKLNERLAYLLDASTDANASRRYLQIKRIAQVKQKSADTLLSILNDMEELQGHFATSPTIARKANRIVNIDKLIDFKGHPVTSQRYRTLVKTKLYTILKNTIDVDAFETNFAEVMSKQMSVLAEKQEQNVMNMDLAEQCSESFSRKICEDESGIIQKFKGE